MKKKKKTTVNKLTGSTVGSSTLTSTGNFILLSHPSIHDLCLLFSLFSANASFQFSNFPSLLADDHSSYLILKIRHFQMWTSLTSPHIKISFYPSLFILSSLRRKLRAFSFPRLTPPLDHSLFCFLHDFCFISLSPRLEASEIASILPSSFHT